MYICVYAWNVHRQMFDWLVFSLTDIFASVANVQLHAKSISLYKNDCFSISTSTVIAEAEFCSWRAFLELLPGEYSII